MGERADWGGKDYRCKVRDGRTERARAHIARRHSIVDIWLDAWGLDMGALMARVPSSRIIVSPLRKRPC